MEKNLRIILLLYALIPFNGISQSDTNHLYLDHIELTLADSSEKLISLVFQNESNSLVFTDTSKLSMIGICRTKICDLRIHTSKSTFTIKNINEYISFIETKYRISIYLPNNHKTCISTTILQPDGLILLHSQTMEQMDHGIDFDNCIEVNSGPTGYTRFGEFEVNFILD